MTFRKTLKLQKVPDFAAAVISADNAFDLYVNGSRIASGNKWEEPVSIPLAAALKAGDNEMLVVVTNGGSGPNPAGLLFHALLVQGGQRAEIVSDATWEDSPSLPDPHGHFMKKPDWKPSVVLAVNPWGAVTPVVSAQLTAMESPAPMVRASLLKSDVLMRTLGRPNREQIVTTRPNDLTTLDAMDLNNGAILDERLAEGAKSLVAKRFANSTELASYVWRAALSREPTAAELQLALSLLGAQPTAPAVQDFLWSIFMLPEFQIIR